MSIYFFQFHLDIQDATELSDTDIPALVSKTPIKDAFIYHRDHAAYRGNIPRATHSFLSRIIRARLQRLGVLKSAWDMPHTTFHGICINSGILEDIAAKVPALVWDAIVRLKDEKYIDWGNEVAGIDLMDSEVREELRVAFQNASFLVIDKVEYKEVI